MKLLTAQHFNSLWDSIFAYLEIIYFTIKDIKPWKFLKIMFRKKKIGCFTSFSINISRSKIHIFGHQIQHDWLAGMHLRPSSYTVWLLYLKHIDSIDIYKNKYCVHKWLLKKLFKKNQYNGTLAKDITALLYTNIALQMKTCTIPYDQGFTHLFG